jgi:hypothetical protein
VWGLGPTPPPPNPQSPIPNPQLSQIYKENEKKLNFNLIKLNLIKKINIKINEYLLTHIQSDFSWR